jgi:hypothetical protein
MYRPMVALKDTYTENCTPSHKPKNALRGEQLQIAGLRYYNPELGRWINRDPFNNLPNPSFEYAARPFKKRYVSEVSSDYWLVGNRPIDRWDYLGLLTCPECCTKHEGPVRTERFDEWRVQEVRLVPGGECHDVVRYVNGMMFVCQRCPVTIVSNRYKGIRIIQEFACYDKWGDGISVVPIECFISAPEVSVYEDLIEEDREEDGMRDFFCIRPIA